MTLELIKECLTDDAKLAIKEALDEKYELFRGDRAFEIWAETRGDIVQVKVILETPEQDFYYPVEGQISYKKEGMGAEEAALFLIDYIDLYYDTYFETGEETLLPIDWSAFEHDGSGFALRGEILNLKLERLADEWLAGHQDAILT